MTIYRSYFFAYLIFLAVYVLNSLAIRFIGSIVNSGVGGLAEILAPY